MCNVQCKNCKDAHARTPTQTASHNRLEKQCHAHADIKLSIQVTVRVKHVHTGCAWLKILAHKLNFGHH